MTHVIEDTTLRDAMYQMSLAKRIPDVELVEEFTRRYPGHAEALTEFAIALALDAMSSGEAEETAASDDAVSPAVGRAMSKFQNLLYARREGQTVDTPTRAVTPSVNPFALLPREKYRALPERIHANGAFLSKLRDRLIVAETIPPRYLRLVADELPTELDALTAHLAAAAEVRHAQTPQFFKSDGKPKVAQRQTFDDAVRNSGLSNDQQKQLLSFKD